MSPLFYAVGASETLDGYCKRVNVRHYTILTKDERLVVTTMLLNNTTMGYF